MTMRTTMPIASRRAFSGLGAAGMRPRAGSEYCGNRNTRKEHNGMNGIAECIPDKRGQASVRHAEEVPAPFDSGLDLTV